MDGLIVKPLYKLLKVSTKALVWTWETGNAFRNLKRNLRDDPALGPPDVTSC